MVRNTQYAIRNKLITRLLPLAFGLCFPFLLLEIGVRLGGLTPPPDPNPAIWTPHPLFGWWHIPYSGGIFHNDFNEFEAEVRVNARGLRDREIGYDNSEGALRILSLADSFGEALQVDLAKTYHKQLEKRLAEQLGRSVEVINAGVGGWGTDQEAIFYVAEGFRYEPEVVLLAFFGRNDVVNNYGPLELASNGGIQDKEFFSLSPDGELMMPPIEDEVHAEVEQETVAPESASEKAGPPLLGLADTLWRRSTLYRFIMPRLRDIPPVVQRLGPSGILGGEAVIRAKHPTIPVSFFVYQSPPAEEFAAAWQLTEAIITRLNQEVAQRGAKLVVVIIGAPEQLNPAELERIVTARPDLSWDVEAPNRRLNAFLTRQNIPHLDLLPVFREAVARPDTPPLHFRHDQHWTEAGHTLAAETIASFLLTEFGAKWQE